MSTSEIVRTPSTVAQQPGIDTAQMRRNLERSVGTITEEMPELGAFRVAVRPGFSLAGALTAARSIRGVSYAEPNYYMHAFQTTPSDTHYTVHQYGPQKVQADFAWALWNPQARTVIAIVDTGVNLTHPDLSGKMFRDLNGTVIGYDYINNDADATDDHGHGTHCAGIAAAQINNGVGISGIAGWNGQNGTDTNYTRIMPVKVLAANGSGTTTGVANGIRFAADNGAKVISLSLGGGASVTLANAVSYAWSKGCVLVAAAGNSGSSAFSYPAAYPNVISVAATDKTDTLASFSNYGSWVVCAAPGVNIISTWGSSYGSLSGTSMATPLVAGEVALLASHAPTLSNTTLRSLILSNTDPVNPYSSRTIGGGRVNVYKALQAANNLTDSPAPPPSNVPNAPTNLTATAVSTSQINLAWTDNATNETKYVLEYSLNGTSGWAATSALLGVNATSVSRTGLAPNSLFYYRVAAVNNGVYSAYSNVASARTFSSNAPAAPTNLTATAVSSSQINLTWTDNSTNETSFVLQYSLDGTTGWTATATSIGANVTSVSQTGLAPDTLRYYRIAAVSNGVYSAYSNVASARTSSANNTPAAPTNLTATAVSRSQINLAWTDNATNETKYVLEYSLNGTSGWTATSAVLGVNATSISRTGLAPNSLFYYRVAAVNNGVYSAYSNVASARTFP